MFITEENEIREQIQIKALYQKLGKIKSRDNKNPVPTVIIIPWVNECQRYKNIFKAGMRDAIERSWGNWKNEWRNDLDHEDRITLLGRYIDLNIIYSFRYLTGFILYIQDPTLLRPLHKFIHNCITSACNQEDKYNN